MSNHYELQIIKYTDAELLEIFPEAKQIVPALIKELGQANNDLLDRIIEQNAMINRENADQAYRDFWKSWFIQPLREERRLTEQKLARLRRLLRVIEGKPLPKGALNADLIQAAKEVPIESIFDQQFKHVGNKAFGLCPFHQEKTGSFVLYKDTNRCYCFGCGFKANAVDAYMRLYDCVFNEAVLALTGNMA